MYYSADGYFELPGLCTSGLLVPLVKKTPVEKQSYVAFSTYLILSPHVRESKTVLDSGFQEVDSGFFVSGTWIPVSSR